QNSIVDSRYAARDWRTCQNFIGSTTAGYREEVHFICPQPTDVPALMEGWSELTQRMTAEIDPVIAAAVAAFAFVFIHPFEDGNGRIHRFLMHHVLAKTGFSPEGVIFPISAAIVRDQRSYDEALESFSRPLFRYIEWHLEDDRELEVLNDTRDLYRFFDATPFAEYLHDRVGDTVRKDLRDELSFIAIFDLALDGLRRIVDMPDRRASLLVRLCMQNSGKLSAAKRTQFPELSDDELAAMERAVQRAVDAIDSIPRETQPALF
ncbi:MAG: Fic family protein, partial [Allosphingosinicella sp.]